MVADWLLTERNQCIWCEKWIRLSSCSCKEAAWQARSDSVTRCTHNPLVGNSSPPGPPFCSCCVSTYVQPHRSDPGRARSLSAHVLCNPSAWPALPEQGWAQHWSTVAFSRPVVLSSGPCRRDNRRRTGGSVLATTNTGSDFEDLSLTVTQR